METHFHLWVEEESTEISQSPVKSFSSDRRPFWIERWDGSEQLVDGPPFGASSVESSAFQRSKCAKRQHFSNLSTRLWFGPYPLRTGRFNLVIPSHSMPADLMDKPALDLSSIAGPGDGASGWLKVMVLRYNSCLPLPEKVIPKSPWSKFSTLISKRFCWPLTKDGS